MVRKFTHGKALTSFITFGIAAVWLINGLFCKVLNLVARHQEIVSTILGAEYAVIATKVIGGSEILMAVWIWSRIKSRLCAITQILVVVLMNIIEFILVPDLLLFGRVNIVIAGGFVVVVYLNAFVLNRKTDNVLPL